MPSKIILFLFFLVILSSCNNDFSTKSGEHHPDISLAVNDDDVLIELNKETVKNWDNFYTLTFNDIKIIDISDNAYSIQRLTDVLITDQGLLILDGGSNKLHSLDLSGKLNEPIAIAGRGPGELSEPINLMRVNDGFQVADRVNGIHHFDINNELVGTNHIKIIPDSICKLDNYFVKSSYVVLDEGPEDHLLYEVNSIGEIISKYSNRYNHIDNLLVFNMSDGPITCLKSKGLVINSYNFTIPIVEFHYPNKEESALYHFTDLNPALLEFSNNNLTFSEQNLGTTYHAFKNHSVLVDRFVIIQFSEIDRPRNSESDYDTRLLSYIIDLDESIYFYSYTIPEIKSTYSDLILFKEVNEDYKYRFASFDIK